MDQIHPSELPNTLSLLPGYPQFFLARRLCFVISCQIALCITSSIIMSYLIYKKFYAKGNKSWKKAIKVMGPIRKRLQNLEKERVIWNSYLEWMEDYCSVYYGLLNYLNSAVTDLDKLYKDRNMTLMHLSDSSQPNSQSDLASSKGGDSQWEGGFMSELSWEGKASDEEFQMVANMAKVFANLKPSKLGSRSGDFMKEEDESNLKLSQTGVKAKSCQEMTSQKEESDNESKIVEYMEMMYLQKKNVFAEYRELYPVCEELKVSDEG